jgi:quercetin dioxygenase-like cupin family protein
VTPEVILGDASDFAERHTEAFPLFVRLMIFARAGDAEPRHAHRDGHFTALLKGRARFLGEGGVAIERTAPALVWIGAGGEHEITALEDGTICACIHDKRALT